MSTEDENDNVSSDTAVDRDGEQQGRGEAAEDRGSWAVQDEDTPSPNLREAWPRVNVDGDKGLVVCTVDVQLLTDTVQVMHSQINLLRQTILDLQQTEAQEMADVRRQIDALKPGANDASDRFNDFDARLQDMEQQPRGSGMDAGQNERLERLEGAVWGDVSAAASETAPSNDDDESAAAAAAVQRGDNDDSGGGGRVEEQEGDAAKPQRTKMKTLAKTVLLFGGLPLCPKVDTLQSQVGDMDKREQILQERLVALESKITADAEGAEAAAAERRRNQLDRLLCQAMTLRSTLVADGIVDVTKGGDAAEEEACWAGLGDNAEKGVGGTIVGNGDGEPAEEELVLKARARLSWLEAQVERAPLLGTPAAAAAPSTGVDAGDDNSEPAADDDLNNDGEAGDQEREAGTSPAVAWASPEEERERLAAARRSSNGGGTVTDEEVERLRCRMDRVESRIYERCADTRRRQSQASREQQRMVDNATPSSVTSVDLQELRESLERSSLALGANLQDGLGSLSGRIGLLEDNVRMVKARALSRSALDAVSAAAAAAAATTGDGGGAPQVVVAPPDDSRIEQILTSVLGDEIPMIRRNLEGVADRMTSLEAALEGSAGPPGLSAEEAAAAAAEAARQANDETQARMVAEISALEERVDRRAREDARRAREEREAAEARGSMRRVSATVSAYTADLAMRLEGLRSEHEQQGAVVTRTAEEIAAAEDGLRNLGSELVGLGQVANSVSMVVEGKADQTDVEALRVAMQRLDATVAAKARGNSATAARDAEAIAALQAAFKDMSSSMEGSMRKLQQAQAAAGSIKIKPLLDRVVKELTTAGMLPDLDAGVGAAGRSMCLSCDRPMTVAGDQSPSKFAAQFRGGTLGSRMEKMSSSSSPLQINKPAVIWRGGFKMPPRKVPPNPNDRQQQQQLHQQQHRRVDPMGTAGGGSRRGAPLAAGGGGGGGRNIGTSRSQLLPASDSVLGGAGADPRLPGIPNMLESAGGDEHGISSAGVLGRGARVSVGSLALSADAPHRGRFVRQR